MKARPKTQPDSGLRFFLRIRHPSMNPEEITRTLAIEPDEVVAAGPTVSNGVRRLHSESYWIAELPGLSLRELAEKYRTGAKDLTLDLKAAALLAFKNATEHDARILFQLKALGIESQQAFLQRINREGGSVALLVDRGEESAPFAIKQALAKLVELGIALEID